MMIVVQPRPDMFRHVNLIMGLAAWQSLLLYPHVHSKQSVQTAAAHTTCPLNRNAPTVISIPCGWRDIVHGYITNANEFLLICTLHSLLDISAVEDHIIVAP